MKPRLIINGAAGRMGRRIAALAVEAGRFDIIAAVDSPDHPDIGADAGVLARVDKLGIELGTDLPKKADCLIDFSLPQAADGVIEHCRACGIALVMGTTGLSDDQVAKIAQTAEKIPVIRASNFSVGMNVLFSLVGSVAGKLGDQYDIEVVEAHHRFKKDSPSGTALTLAENIARETGRDFPACLVHGRSGKDALRQKGTIGMHSVRAGDITGEHSVIFSTLGETLTLAHSAHSRDNFARGALRAAEWIVGKTPGAYSMADVLGI